MALVLVTGPPASGKNTIARPLARQLGVPLLGKDVIKEALFDALGTGDRAWSRRLGQPATRCCWPWRVACPRPYWMPTSTPTTAQGCCGHAGGPIEVFCRCPAVEVERRLFRRAPARHPGHVDHVFDAQLNAMVEGGMEPLDLGGPVLEVDTSGLVDVTAVAGWAKQQPEWHIPSPSRL